MKNTRNLAITAGAALALSLASSTAFAADANPFGITSLHNGIQTAMDDSTPAEGKCGGSKSMPAEGKCGGSKAKTEEGKCGAGKTKTEEGKCGASKAPKEGKCGEGKCGANKAK